MFPNLHCSLIFFLYCLFLSQFYYFYIVTLIFGFLGFFPYFFIAAHSDALLTAITAQYRGIHLLFFEQEG